MEELSISDELKKHYLKRNSVGSIATVIDFNTPLYSKYGEDKYILDNLSDENNKNKKKVSFITRYKINLMCRVVISLIIFIATYCYKYYPENIKQSRIVAIIKEQYNKNYSKNEVIENIEDLCKYCYEKSEKIIPKEIYSKVVTKYLENIKPKLINADINNIFKSEEITVAVFNEEDFKITDDGFTPIEEAISVNSEVSLMSLDVDEILSKNISIIQPVYGTITSQYGARERILDVVGYHTGIDIANAYNTEIKSATDGIVVKAEQNNYYYGNNIEVENNGVIFKYAHMNKLLVNQGDNVSQNQVIGLMGATGQATGSHLHFEIRINGRTVDPEMVIEIK